MARYKDYDYSQGKFIPIHFDRQILPGTFEYSLHYLIDNEIDLSLFSKVGFSLLFLLRYGLTNNFRLFMMILTIISGVAEMSTRRPSFGSSRASN